MSATNSTRPPSSWAARIFKQTVRAFVVLAFFMALASNFFGIKPEVTDKLKVEISITDPSITKLTFNENGSKVKIEVDFAVHLSLTNISQRPINLANVDISTFNSIGKEKWIEGNIEVLGNGELSCFNKEQPIGKYTLTPSNNLGAKLRMLVLMPGENVQGWLIGTLPRKSSNRIEKIKVLFRTHEGDREEIFVVIPMVIKPEPVPKPKPKPRYKPKPKLKRKK
jgi:hypothetical protein